MSLYILQYYPSSGDSIFDYFCVAIIIVFFIGLLIYILIIRQGAAGKKTVRVQQPVQQKQEPDRRCPNCGRAIPFDANICPYCKRDFEK